MSVDNKCDYEKELVEHFEEKEEGKLNHYFKGKRYYRKQIFTHEPYHRLEAKVILFRYLKALESNLGPRFEVRKLDNTYVPVCEVEKLIDSAVPLTFHFQDLHERGYLSLTEVYVNYYNNFGVECQGLIDVYNCIIKAVNKLHDAGLVHSDLKPSNIFLRQSNSNNRKWHIRFIDFDDSCNGVCTGLDPYTARIRELEFPNTEFGYYPVTDPDGMQRIQWLKATHWNELLPPPAYWAPYGIPNEYKNSDGSNINRNAKKILCKR